MVRVRPPSLGRLPTSSLWGITLQLHFFLNPVLKPFHHLGNLPILGPTRQAAGTCAIQFPVSVLTGQFSFVTASFKNLPSLGICVFFLRFVFHMHFISLASVTILLSLVF